MPKSNINFLAATSVSVAKPLADFFSGCLVVSTVSVTSAGYANGHVMSPGTLLGK